MRPPRLTVRMMMVAVLLIGANIAPFAMMLRQSSIYRREYTADGQPVRYYNDGSVGLEKPNGRVVMVGTPTFGPFRDPKVIVGFISILIAFDLTLIAYIARWSRRTKANVAIGTACVCFVLAGILGFGADRKDRLPLASLCLVAGFTVAVIGLAGSWSPRRLPR